MASRKQVPEGKYRYQRVNEDEENPTAKRSILLKGWKPESVITFEKGSQLVRGWRLARSKEKPRELAFGSHIFAMAVRPFRSFRSFGVNLHCGLQVITIIAKKVCCNNRWSSIDGRIEREKGAR
jgi:hypothetical protein